MRAVPFSSRPLLVSILLLVSPATADESREVPADADMLAVMQRHATNATSGETAIIPYLGLDAFHPRFERYDGVRAIYSFRDRSCQLRLGGSNGADVRRIRVEYVIFVTSVQGRPVYYRLDGIATPNARLIRLPEGPTNSDILETLQRNAHRVTREMDTEEVLTTLGLWDYAPMWDPYAGGSSTFLFDGRDCSLVVVDESRFPAGGRVRQICWRTSLNGEAFEYVLNLTVGDRQFKPERPLARDQQGS